MRKYKTKEEKLETRERIVDEVEVHAMNKLEEEQLPALPESKNKLTFLEENVARAFCLFKGDLERIQTTLKIKELYEVLAILADPKVKKEIQRLEEPVLQQVMYEALKIKTPKIISWGDKFKYLELRHKIRGDIKNDGGNKTQVNIGIGYE